MAHADFEVFTVTARLANGAGEATFLRAYTRFDRQLVGAMKTHTSACFRKDAAGRGYWETATDSRYADKFRQLIANAALRSGVTAPRNDDYAAERADEIKDALNDLRDDNLMSPGA